MPTHTKHSPQHRRSNAKPPARPRRRQGIRNAAPPGSRRARARAAVGAALRAATPEQEETKFRRLGLTVIGTGVGSVVGALATRWGFHPQTTAIVVGASGLAMSALFTDPRQRDYRNAGTGAFSAGASQLVLMLLKGMQDVAAQKQAAAQTASKEPARPPQRQLAALPPAPHFAPGALDAAFERARSALAVDADGHAYAYGHDFG
jgi:hypothetical protein